MLSGMDQSAQSSASHQQQDPPPPEAQSSVPATPSESTADTPRAAPDSTRPGGAGDESRPSRRNKRNDLGRRAWGRQSTDVKKRSAEGSPAPKRRKAEDGESSIPIFATEFSQEDIDADQRRPKKKVAVLMSYSGTGYHGMQMSNTMKTIEGELFPAFVAAGAISKANAMDPKKSSFTRCARTDKGVHAAGNVVSLKLIIEDHDVVEKINRNLSSQIRVWGIVPATKGFSCYQLCDSRIYEYLIPSHCFLPPHPSTFLARKLREIAEEQGKLEDYEDRQKEVSGYWDDIDDKYIKPIIARLPEQSRKEVLESLCIKGDMEQASSKEENQPSTNASGQGTDNANEENAKADPKNEGENNSKAANDTSEPLTVDQALTEIRAAYFKAKENYRIHPSRLERINKALGLYVGTRNYHNYTVKVPFNNPSAKRVIKSFQVSRDPIVINGVEWLSLKVHGQSFMMHQIRKMVAMVALLVRCGTDLERITQSYGPDQIAIPRAPGLGLLLERPIFDNYNKRAGSRYNKDPVEFSKYEKQLEEFKEREIYQRIFREEAEAKAFGNFFNHIDTFPDNAFLYVTAGGIPASKSEGANKKKPGDNTALAEVESESEGEEADNDGEEGG